MARKRTRLMPEEREHVNEILASVSGEIQTGDSGHIANRAITYLMYAFERGEKWARTAVEHFAEEGLRQYVIERMHASDVSRIRRSDTGEVVKTPSRVGVIARTAEGVKEGYFQQEFWWGLAWPIFVEKLDEYIKTRDTADTKIAIFGEVLKLRQRFPETRTAEEACERAGIDPRAFGVEGDALSA